MNREHLNSVLDEGLRFGVDLLERRGEFYPFAVIETFAGAVEHVQGLTGSEYPPSDDVLRVLRDRLRREALSGTMRACAIISDVRIRKRDTGKIAGDAIRADVEDIEEGAVTCFLPYSIIGGEVRTGTIRAEPASAVV